MSCRNLQVQSLASRWGEYIRSNYHSERQVMAAFSVSERTARYWLNEGTEPRAAHFDAALRVASPDQRERLLGLVP